jgi:hypothetical protein
MKKQIVLLLVLLFSVSAAYAVSESVGTTCGVKAIVDSAVSSTASINWQVNTPPKITYHVNVGKDPDVNVDWQSKDDSRTVGYPCAVSANVEIFNFSSWAWQSGGGGNSIKGANAGFGKYNNYGTWTIPLNQTWPVSKYKMNAMADTRGKPTKNESKEFYVARIAPMGVRSATVRNAAEKWIAGRYERALALRSFADTWTKMKNPNSTVNFDLEMTKLIGSCGALFGSTSATDYGADSGLEVLGLVSNLFGNAATSGLVASGGAVWQAYSWGTWARDTLNNASSQLKSQFNATHIMNAATYDYASYMTAAADAMRDEADELAKIIWTAPNASDATWKAKLNTELQKLDLLHTAGGSARTAANAYFNALTGQTGWAANIPMPPLPPIAAANKDTITKYFDSVREFVRADRAILQQAINGTFSQT